MPLLKQAAMKNSDKPFGCSKAAVINMSSILGSISLNTDGGLYPYRCSKVLPFYYPNNNHMTSIYFLGRFKYSNKITKCRFKT